MADATLLDFARANDSAAGTTKKLAKQAALAGYFKSLADEDLRLAVRFAAGSVRAVYLSDEAAVRHPEIAVAADDAGLVVRLGTPAVLDAMSADAQGVVAVVGLLGTSLPAVLAGAPRLVALLAHVRDPGNAGTVVRAADGVGADAVVLANR